MSEPDKLTSIYYEAVGRLQSSYNLDLANIQNFQRYKKQKNDGYLVTFKSYLIKSGVARNVKKGRITFLLDEAWQWANQSQSDNVDEFAKLLRDKGLTHGKVMTSLASKILYLNDPWNIIPIDNIAKKAFGLNTNFYFDYLPALEKFKIENKGKVEQALKSVEEVLKSIEKDFGEQISNIELIRYNRFIDKLINLIGISSYS